jgi:hypothetical protein
MGSCSCADLEYVQLVRSADRRRSGMRERKVIRALKEEEERRRSDRLMRLINRVNNDLDCQKFML